METACQAENTWMCSQIVSVALHVEIPLASSVLIESQRVMVDNKTKTSPGKMAKRLA